MAGRELTIDEQELVAQLRDEADKTRELAEQGGWAYGSVAALVLDLGRWFVAARDVEGQADPTYSGPATWARQTRGWAYVEGFFLPEGGAATLGAWCVRSGEVVYGRAGRAYLGIAMPEGFRAAQTRRTGVSGVFIDQPRANYALLRSGLPVGAVLDVGYASPS